MVGFPIDDEDWTYDDSAMDFLAFAKLCVNTSAIDSCRRVAGQRTKLSGKPTETRVKAG